MTTIIPFRQKRVTNSLILPVDPADARPDMLRPARNASESDGEVERHWGVAVALASWPLCLGASVVLATL